MSFFVRLDQNDFTGLDQLFSGFSKPRDDYPCTLFVDYDTQKKVFTYSFNPPQFVLWDAKDTIIFTLVNKVEQMAHMRLHKHCCTDKDSPQLIKFGSDFEAPETAQAAYHSSATSVRMRLTLAPLQMVHIGLIVQIVPKIASLKEEFLLCDPQVGSGPP